MIIHQAKDTRQQKECVWEGGSKKEGGKKYGAAFIKRRG